MVTTLCYTILLVMHNAIKTTFLFAPNAIVIWNAFGNKK